MISKLFTVFILVIALIACKSIKTKPIENINGVWESIGSGWILEINDSTEYVLYDVTSISCLPNEYGDYNQISASVDLKNDTLYWRNGVITYSFISAQALPDLCGFPIDDKKTQEPIYNFKVFAETVKEHYAFFELNQINWEELYAKQMAKLSSNSSDAELYLIIEETLDALNDNHAFLEATDEVHVAVDMLIEEEAEFYPDLPEYGDFQVAKMVAEHHIKEDMTDDSWLVHWGLMTDDIGFVQIKAMWLHGDLDIPQPLIDDVGYVDAYVETFHTMNDGDYMDREVSGVRKIMDKILSDLSETKSIVLE